MSNEEKKVFMHERLCVSIVFASVCVSVFVCAPPSFGKKGLMRLFVDESVYICRCLLLLLYLAQPICLPRQTGDIIETQ